MTTREVASEYRMVQWAQAIQERASSGVSIREFCQSRGVSKNTYFYWQKKLRAKACEHLAEVQGKQTGLAVRGFTEIKLAQTPLLPAADPTSQICVETGDYKITADSAYPVDKLAAFLRSLQC